MSAIEVVNDLIDLEQLAEHEGDNERRLVLLGVHDHVADRAQGAKISEASRVLELSAPTIRAWIEAGVLEVVPDRTPVRVTFGSLAAAKRALGEVRAHPADRYLVVDVLRLLRDRAVLRGDDVTSGLADLHQGRRTVLTPGKLNRLIPKRERGQRSKSS
jgi:hypothetical protein